MPVHTIPGLHHVTAISGPPQRNLDFYAGTLGQRLVKRTVNFDAPDTYHLYYGNAGAEPGSILTFFPFVDAGPGRAGPGAASAVAYAVPDLAPWAERLRGQAEPAMAERFGGRVLLLTDPDGMLVELVEEDGGDGAFHSATLWLADLGPTARLLVEHFGYEEVGEAVSGGETRLRLQSPGKGRASILDLVRTEAPAAAAQGAGSIHHVAFRAESDAVQEGWRERLRAAGFNVTPVIDRQYFNAIYFREPGGVLFEIATDPPGFAVDEPEAALGQALKLPAKYEAVRDRIEAILPPLTLPG